MESLSFGEIAGLAVALAMDAFAVSLGTGAFLRQIHLRQYFRLSFHFGLFQLLMPLAGWYMGSLMHGFVSSWDHWIALALLWGVGGKMLLDARDSKASSRTPDPTRGLCLIVLSLATSIDALAVGLSLGFLSVGIWLPSIIIGLVAAAATVLGLKLGGLIGAKFGRWAETAGGLVLIAIGVRMLLEHL